MKKFSSSSKKSAFSLIELSIVLIIIGLLIAGITGGASLIKSSELRSVMSEARGYATAVNAFYTQYGQYPGDYNVSIGGSATTSTANSAGDNDGKIEYYDGTNSEGKAAWEQLKNTGGISDSITPTLATVAQTISQSGGGSIPASKLKLAGWAFDYNTTSLQNVVTITAAIGAASSGNTVVNGTTVATAALVGPDALSVDMKLDDGVSTTGKVRGVNPGATTCISGTSYVTTSTSTKVCALSYQIDINS